MVHCEFLEGFVHDRELTVGRVVGEVCRQHQVYDRFVGLSGMALIGTKLGEAAIDYPGDISVHAARVVPVDYGSQGVVSVERIDIDSKGAPFDLHT